MKRYLIIIFYLALSDLTQANNNSIQPTIPLFVTDLDTYRVRDEIIRVVTAYETYSPMVYIERIKTPDFMLLEQFTVNSLTLSTGNKNEKILTFEDISGVFIEKMEMKNTTLSILFDYIPARGSSFLVDCTIFIGEKEFEPMQCTRKERP